MFVAARKHQLVLFMFLSCIVLWCNGESEDLDSAPMEEKEKEALYSAIQGFVGDWWNGFDLYPDPCGWTPIQGVSCDVYDGLWYVTGLTLGPVHENSLACGISLEFRAQIFELKHMKYLSFFRCIVSPIKIPTDGWLNLAISLESLEFRSNPGLIGEFPDSLGSLTKLQSLLVFGNGLRGNLPVSIGNLTRLKRLVIAGNSLTGNIPDCFSRLKELLILDLSSNSLSGSLPSSLGGLVSLLKLDLSNNKLEGKIPQKIRLLKNLTLLDLRNNNFSGGLAHEIENIESLRELVLSNNPTMGGDMMGIKWERMGNLVILDLCNMGLTGEIPESFTRLKSLRYLGLSNNKLTGNVSPKLETLPCLGSLYINGNNLTGFMEFSRMFYEKMGRRFSAGGNPNLCYPTKLISEVHGVKPCMMTKKEGNLGIQQDSKTLI